MRRLITLILSLFTLLGSLFGVAPAEAAPTPAPRGFPQASAPESASEAVPAIGSGFADLVADRARLAARQADALVRFSDIPYAHYDPEAFYADCGRLVTLAEAGDAEPVTELYDRLYDEFLYEDSLYTYAMLRHDMDMYDDYWAGEYAWCSGLWADMWDVFLEACAGVMGTSCARAFASHVGRDMVWLLRAYAPEEGSDHDFSYDYEDIGPDRELELLDEYHLALDAADHDVTFELRGETWDFEKLYGFSGDALAWRDYDAYIEIYDGLNRALAGRFAPIYSELAALWTQEAVDAGYDSYVDYAYEAVFARDYSPEEAQRFCDAVKPIAREYYADLYYSDISYDYDRTSPDFTGAQLIAILGEYLPRIDERLTEPWDAMTERGLYDLGEAESGRYGGAYTTSMIYYRAPFLFATLDGSCWDLITVTHEFGHFCDYWFNPQTNVFTQTSCLDLSEIHSNGLQALFTAFYGEIYDRGADVAEYSNLSDLLENVIDGCVYDEFQRRVLSDPADLTAEKLNDIYMTVCAEYGMEGEWTWDSGWVYVPHNFEQPLYYISYAASAIAAIQLWDMAQTDFDAAVDAYLAVLDYGSYKEEYARVLQNVGLRLFTEENAVPDICRPLLTRLEELDRNY